MCYSLKRKDDTRLWYCAPPKTGSQSIRKLIDENLLSKKAEAGKSWHVPAHQIVKLGEFNRHSDQIFATIRNPFMVHASNFIYQQKKLDEKIAGISNPEKFIKENPLVNFKPKQENWVNAMHTSRKEVFKDFGTYIDKVRDWSVPKLWEGNMKRHFLDKHGSSLNSIITLTNFVNGLESNIFLFKIEEPDILEWFFRDVFDIQVELPHINKTGFSGEYKDLFSSKTKRIIEELEAPLIKLGNYKY